MVKTLSSPLWTVSTYTMHSQYASHKSELNCVAVDVVAKTLIVAGWKCAIDNGKSDSGGEKSNEILNDRPLSVYNCAGLHNMDLELLVYDGQYLIRQYPFERFVWLPGEWRGARMGWGGALAPIEFLTFLTLGGGVTLCKVMNYSRVSFSFTHRQRHRDANNENCNAIFVRFGVINSGIYWLEWHFADRLFSTFASCAVGSSFEGARETTDVGFRFKWKTTFAFRITSKCYSRLMKLQRKIAHASLALKIFIFSEWNFGVDNFHNLNKILLPCDE